MTQLIDNYINSLPVYIQAVLIVLLAIASFGGVISALKIFLEYFFSKTKLIAKVTESYTNSSSQGNIYLFNISILNVGNKIFYPKTWIMKLKYKDENRFIDTKLMPMRYMQMSILDVNATTKRNKRLKTENIKFIQIYPIIRPEELISAYFSLVAEGYNEDKNIDSILIEAVDFSGKKKNIYIDYKNLKSGDLFHDDSIWEIL